MKQSNLYIPTLKDVSSSAEVKSHRLLLKAGYIHQSATGIYTYLPIATKILQKIQKEIRKELDKIGANEVMMPFLQLSDLWQKSGRWDNYGAELFTVEDRHQRTFALAPTHEEVATDLVKNYLNSYKKFPLNIYQIQTKMRDEKRPRSGLLRGREFIMMDGYTFDIDEKGLESSYNSYYTAYKEIFDKLGLEYKIVKADNGSMGGNNSHEFMAISTIGEDYIVYEEGTDIAYNIEAAPVYTKYEMDTQKVKEKEEVHTPGIKTIEDLNSFFEERENLVKAVCYRSGEQLVVAFVCGDKEVESVKLAKAINSDYELEIADEELLKQHNIITGFIGPEGLDSNIKVVFDNEIKYKKNLVVGANKRDYHFKNYNLGEVKYADIRAVQSGDIIREGGSPVKITKGIEIGHIFALGKRYTESLDVKYLDEKQKNQVPTMGSYGIGVSRLLAAIVEQNSTDDEIILPSVISPYDVHIIPLDYNSNEEQTKFTNEILKDLERSGISYLLDDRMQRPGSKFKDAELIGIPIHIIIGKKFSEDIIEVKIREKNQKVEIRKEEFLNLLKGEIHG